MFTNANYQSIAAVSIAGSSRVSTLPRLALESTARAPSRRFNAPPARVIVSPTSPYPPPSPSKPPAQRPELPKVTLSSHVLRWSLLCSRSTGSPATDQPKPLQRSPDPTLLFLPTPQTPERGRITRTTVVATVAVAVSPRERLLELVLALELWAYSCWARWCGSYAGEGQFPRANCRDRRFRFSHRSGNIRALTQAVMSPS